MISDRLIGSDEDGGLSLEQRKRTTLGVELAANPSLIFLDEPTSGLDARSAQVMYTVSAAPGTWCILTFVLHTREVAFPPHPPRLFQNHGVLLGFIASHVDGSGLDTRSAQVFSYILCVCVCVLCVYMYVYAFAYVYVYVYVYVYMSFLGVY